MGALRSAASSEFKHWYTFQTSAGFALTRTEQRDFGATHVSLKDIDIMKVVSFIEAQANLGALLDAVCKDNAPTTIKREHGEDVVVLTRSEFGSLTETLYLLGTENNARNLRESIAQLKAGQIVRHEPFLKNDEPKGEEPTIGPDFRRRLV